MMDILNIYFEKFNRSTCVEWTPGSSGFECVRTMASINSEDYLHVNFACEERWDPGEMIRLIAKI